MNENLKTILAMAITAAGTLFATTTGYFNTSRELDIKMVDVSLAILRGEKGDGKEKQSVHARTFALRALSQYSGVKLKDSDLNSWAESGLNLQFSPVSNESFMKAFKFAGTPTWTAKAILQDNQDVPEAKFIVRVVLPEKNCRNDLGLFNGSKFHSCYLGVLKPNEKRP